MSSTQVEVMLKNVRLSYAYLAKPYQGKREDGSISETYTCHALMPKDLDGKPHPGIELIKAATRQVAQAAWPQDWQAKLQALAAQDKIALHDGDVTKQGKDGYKGMFFVSANNAQKAPTVLATIDGQNAVIPEGHPLYPYSGCWANVKVAVWAQSPASKPVKWGPRVNVQLMGVQFVKHDSAFGGGGRVADANEFELVAGDADDPAPTAPADATGGLL